MKRNSNITAFLSKGATVFFAKGTDNSNIARSNVGKMAVALSLAGAVALATPSQAEARGSGGAIMGLIGGMMIGSMMSRGAVAAPIQSYQQYQQPYYGNGGYGNQGYGNQGYGNGGGRPGFYYCPQGPQYRCFWKSGSLEIHDEGKAAELEVATPSFKMG
jgi:hypothetical protein